MFRRKNKNATAPMYYDSDAIYRQQSIYGNGSIFQQQGTYTPPTPESQYTPPSAGYQPPVPVKQERPAEVGYRPPLFPGSAELAEVVPEPVKEEEQKRSTSVVLKKSLQNVASSLRKVQERARRSSMAHMEETEEERSIKSLFTERIVKGRPDLFVPSTPLPSSPSPDTPSALGVLQGNISGFFNQFARQQSALTDQDSAMWSDREKEFNKRFNRNDTQYLRDALNNFCEETHRMYDFLIPADYVPTPENTPRENSSEASQTPVRSENNQVKSVSQPIEERIHSFMDALMAEVKKHKAWKNATPELLRDTRDCIEKMILLQLRDVTLGAVREEFKREDTDIEAKLQGLQFLTMENLDVSAVCRGNPEKMDEVLKQLQNIQNVFSPAEKLECIIESNRTLGALLQSGTKGSNDAGADDFLPAFIYIVLKSGIPKLPSTVEYISRFRHPDELLSEGGYCLTNLSGAVSFLQNCGGCDFDIDPDEYESHFAQHSPVPTQVVEEEEEEDLLCF